MKLRSLFEAPYKGSAKQMALEFQQTLLDGIDDLELKNVKAFEADTHFPGNNKRLYATFTGTLTSVPNWSCHIGCSWLNVDGGTFEATIATSVNATSNRRVLLKDANSINNEATGPDDTRYCKAMSDMISRQLYELEQKKHVAEKRDLLGGLSIDIESEDDIRPYKWDLSNLNAGQEVDVGNAIRAGKKVHAIMIPKGGDSAAETAAFVIQTNKFNDEVLRASPRPQLVKLDASNHMGFYCVYAL